MLPRLEQRALFFNAVIIFFFKAMQFLFCFYKTYINYLFK